jgi:hypothetical protein
VADTSTIVPGRDESFRAFSCVTALDGSIVAFEADRSGSPVKRGVYAARDGDLLKVVDSDDLVDGRVVQRPALGDHQSLSAGRLATLVRFDDGSSGFYLTSDLE